MLIEYDLNKIDKYINMECIEVKNTKTFLNKTLVWSSSRYNEYKKKDVIDFIYNIKKEQHNFITSFDTGGFVDNGRNRCGSYIVVKKDDDVRLIVGSTVYKLI